MSLTLLPFAFLAGLVVGALLMRSLALRVLRTYQRREQRVQEGLATMAADLERLGRPEDLDGDAFFTGEQLAERAGLPPDIDTAAPRAALHDLPVGGLAYGRLGRLGGPDGPCQCGACVAYRAQESLASNGRTGAPALASGRRIAAGDQLGDQLEELLGDLRALLTDHGTVQHVDGECVACKLVGRIDAMNAAAAEHELGEPVARDLGADPSPRVTVGDEWSIDALERAALAYYRHGAEQLAAYRANGSRYPTTADDVRTAIGGRLMRELLDAAQHHGHVTDAQRTPPAPPAPGPLVHMPHADDDAPWSCIEDGDQVVESDNIDDQLERVTCPHCLARELSFHTEEARIVWDRLELVTARTPAPPAAAAAAPGSLASN